MYEDQEEETSKEEKKQETKEQKAVDQVKMVDFLHPNDAHFAVTAARTYLAVYNDFLRSR